MEPRVSVCSSPGVAGDGVFILWPDGRGMAKTRRVHRKAHHKGRKHHRKSNRKQRGGASEGGYGSYSFNGAAFEANGVPFESRGIGYSHCGPELRQPPQIGGRRRRSRKQSGGGCGCMAAPPMQAGGGGGTGGYGFDLTSNEMGKVYAATTVGACPPARQVGGANPPAPAPSPYQVVSYPAGYGYGPAGVVSTDSAHYLDQSAYDRTCQGGGRRMRKTRRHQRRR
jgi:hypothetical protein